MNNNFDFFKWEMPESRKADYYLGCLDSCVFMDFNISKEKLIYLIRISFDGYGCYGIEENSKPLNEEYSKEFIKLMEDEELNQKNITFLVKKAINLNKDYISKDALLEYNLLD